MSKNLRCRLPRLGLFTLLLFAAYLLAPTARTAPPPQEGPAMTPPAGGGWEEVERLISEDKYEAAARLTGEIKTAAREAGDEAEWARALIREVQLRMGLHGYETAVRFLAEETWPQAPRQQAILRLFYAQSLTTYLQAYSWEIGQRERVETGGAVDLKAWTQDQIFAEAQRAFLEVWHQRVAWEDEPLGDLAEYFDQNNYPPRIRGTLRDTVTYLYADLLGNSGFWSPRQSNELFRLDLGELLAARGGEAVLADPEAHPLTQIAALLGDLETWHRRGQRPEAAFEARRDLLSRLTGSFTRAEDRLRIREDLEHHLEALGRRFEWWSVGMATLAGMVRDEEGPDSLVRAREIALDGERAHPDSVGGRQCRHLVATLEAPDYSLTAMAADGGHRRSIQVTHRNLTTLHFRAFALDLVSRVEQARDYNLLPGWREVPEILGSRDPDASWSVELPATPDYRLHRTFVTPPLTDPGLYLIVASARRDFREQLNRRSAVNFLLTDLVLLLRKDEDGDDLEVTARSGATGEALADARITVYRYDWQRGHRPYATRTTRGDGTARFSLDENRHRYFVLARRGSEEALEAQGQWGFTSDGGPGERTAALVYTDRSIYRPLQKALWKVVAYHGSSEQGRFQVLPDRRLTVELVDANQQVVASADATTNTFGSASGEFDLPAGRLLGRWWIRASVGGAAQIRVEEYKRPTFEVTLGEPESALRLNRPATLPGEAHYYFGLPLTQGQVAWRVTREPVFPRWWWFWYGPPAAQAQTVAGGVVALEPDGTFQVTFTPEADERDAASGMTYRYRLSAEITDEGGETRSASRTFRLGFVAVEAVVSSGTAFVRRGEPGELTVRRSDLDGIPRPGEGSWRLLALEQPAETLLPAEQPLPDPPQGAGEAGAEPFHTAGDRLRPRWEADYRPEAVLAAWRDGREVASGRLEHDEEGQATLPLPDLPPGAYRLRYATRDAFGAPYETFHDFVVTTPGATPLALPALLQVERTSVPVGQTARLLVHSGLPDQQMLLEIFRGDRRIEARRLTSRPGLQVLEIPITAEDRGGLGVRLTVLRDHQLMKLSESLLVPWDDRRLKVELATFRDRLVPGGRETWTVKVSGPEGETLEIGAAELLAYMYDRSLDLFAPHQPPNPLGLYPIRLGVPSLWSSLGSGSEVWRQDHGFVSLPGYPSLTGDRLDRLSGYGIGGPGLRRSIGGRMEMAMGAVAEEMAVRAPSAKATDAVSDFAPARPAPPSEPAPGPAEEPVALRTDFSETAFWEPHLLLDADGTVSFEFTVPDSVTEWNVWVHALTRDLAAGSLTQQVRSVKDLMVRPYLPRFLREGDVAEIPVVVNNAGEVPLEGVLDFDIQDPETGESLLAEFGLSPRQASAVPFAVEAGGGTTLRFGVHAPARVGSVAFRITARAAGLADGELRPLPLLPGRMHLAQSRFATLRDRDRRTLTFPDLAAEDDPTRIDEQLVVTLDAQLFYSVLSALPYLVSYPYECTEQTLNRFLSTGIVSTLYDEYPAVARMAKRFSERETRLETWDQTDPNRKMALEETPWLIAARGGDEPAKDLINVLDPRVARAQRRASLAKLEKAQTSLGGFPWWPGGPPSPYMTLYLLHGFSKALEFGVEVPQEPVVRAWAYLHRHYLDTWARALVEEDCCWEWITFLNYVLSSYPEGQTDTWTGGVFTADDRRQMLDFSFRHWRSHSPLLKSYLALTLERAGRGADAKLVFDSVMDSAKTELDLGTYWAPEDRAWLWYNDTIETHAFALRTLSELDPADARRHGLVQWLLLNKKLNHWKSTRATAEVVYALVHYLEKEGALGVREEATVTVGPKTQVFTFEPDRYTGKKAQLVIPGEAMDPAHSTVVVQKETPGFLFASATWHFSTERLPEEASGDFFSVHRRYFKRQSTADGWVLQPLEDGAPLAPGDQVEVQLSLRAKHAAEYVHLRDPRPAGFEPETLVSRYQWGLGIGWYEEVRDSGTNFFFDWLPVGEYTFKYRLRAAHAGTFKVAPATVQPMYAPEFVAYSAGKTVAVAAPTAP